MKTAGVIGGNDFLGCDITLKLLSEDYRVKILIPDGFDKPVIHTGLKAGRNLLFCRSDMDNLSQVESFLKDCDYLIHCGTPYKLELNAGEGKVYVPVISHTGTLLKCIKKFNSINKIIFFTSVAVYYQSKSDKSSTYFSSEKTEHGSGNKTSEKAISHFKQITDNILDNFSDNQIEIVVVSPVVVLNNVIINNEKITLAGLRYIFTHEIQNDRTFQRLVRRKPVKTMVNASQLPDMVYNSINNYQESETSLNIS